MRDASENSPVLTVAREQRAGDGVRKYLVELSDAAKIETVVIPGERRTTLCVSSQVGCAVGCTFCATGSMGAGRDLSADEIVGQYRLARDAIAADDDGVPCPIENVVYMGMGEPFLNREQVGRSLHRLIDDHGFHSKIITVSTIGIPRHFVPFGREFPHVRLAVSLHAARDEDRTRMIPINRRYPLAELMDACRAYNDALGKKVFIEYVMIAGVNDSERDAEDLARLLDGVHATVNMIPLNAGGIGGDERPSREACDAFRARLKETFPGHVTFRRSRGTDIDAACGQLAVRTV